MCIYTLLEMHESFDASKFFPTEWHLEPMEEWEPPTLDPSDLENYSPELNPFYGGDIQREAHANGNYAHLTSEVRSSTVTETWIGAEERKQRQAVRIKEAQKKNRERIGEDEFSRMQSEKGQKAALVLSSKLMYNGILYYGWRELKEQTGVSKYKFLKYNMGQIL